MGLIEIASRLIAKHGQAATLLRPGDGTVDEYGGYTPGPDTAYPVTIISASYAVELQQFAAGYLNMGDQRVFVSVEGLTVQPQTSDKLLIDGIKFEARRVSRLAPAGEAIFWEMQVFDV